MQAPKDALAPPSEHATEELLGTLAEWQTHVQSALPWVGRGAGLAAAGTSLAREVLGVVKGMHGTIASATPPLQQDREGQTRGVTKLVYDCIETGFGGLQKTFDAVSEAFPKEPPGPKQWSIVQAAINGVMGDRLAREANSLAIPMELVEARGEGPRWLLFLHGLCIDHNGWDGPAHEGFAAARVAAGQRVAYLRYNTGRHISENGEDLSELLERAWSEGAFTELDLIGHSMGGLVMRAALATAAEKGHGWPQTLRQSVYLGSPHHGSPWERLGNHANRLLKVTAYTAPFMRLGNIRSDGIKDLRHGNLRRSDWLDRGLDDTDDRRQPTPLHGNSQHLLVAATRSEALPDDPLQAKDDYLVPVSSALGVDAAGQTQLDGENVSTLLLANTTHLQLLHAPWVYDALGEHLGPA